jgi:hypothetical protein
LVAASEVLRKIAKRMVPMDRELPVSQPRSASPEAPEQQPDQKPDQQPEHHHPVPSGLVRLYGLLAVLFVLLPEWMADLRQLSRQGRDQAHGADRDRLSVTLSRQAQQSGSGSQWPVTVGRAALLVGVGAGLVWGANQWRPLAQTGSSQAVPSNQASPLAVAGMPAGQLKLQSSGRSWVEVRSLEGETLYAAILQGQVLLPLGRGVKVLAGRPDLVRVAVAGEQPRVLGRIDQIGWVGVPVREGLAPP